MKAKIRNLVASVKYGPHLSTEDEGDIKYLKGNHFDEDNQLNDFSDSYLFDDPKTKNFLLTEQNMILAAKGFRNFAWSYDKQYGKCVASSLFYVFQVDEKKVLSQFLALCMNAPRFQHQLKLIGLGSNIPAIPKNELLRLAIDLPSLEVQRKTIELHKLMLKQIALEKKIIEKRKKMNQGLIDLLTTTQP